MYPVSFERKAEETVGRLSVAAYNFISSFFCVNIFFGRDELGTSLS